MTGAGVIVLHDLSGAEVFVVSRQIVRWRPFYQGHEVKGTKVCTVDVGGGAAFAEFLVKETATEVHAMWTDARHG